MDEEPPSLFFIEILASTGISSAAIIMNIIFLMILLVASALISGSEIAYFSLTENDKADLEAEGTTSSKLIIQLLEQPRKLLATILIGNNLVNIGIVILSSYVLDNIFPESTFIGIGQAVQDSLGFSYSTQRIAGIFNLLINVVFVTFLLVLFGEVAPKIYANFNSLNFSRLMARPLNILNKVFGPISFILVKWTHTLEKKLGEKASQKNYLKEYLDQAIELTMNNDSDEEGEADILRSIINFSDITVRQIMCPRMDVVALDKTSTHHQLIQTIKDSGYSRIPIFEEDFDKVCGILYVKDLIAHIDEPNDFDWTTLIREDLLYAPETKKVNELLKEFQQKRMHMAIVVDEYGGTAGIVTLEDVMEEVVGEIHDEFDEEEEIEYVKIDDKNYVFDGKTSLHDVARITGIDVSLFDDAKGESDSLAGIILERVGIIPKVDKEIKVKNIQLKVVSVNKRRIEKISVKII